MTRTSFVRRSLGLLFAFASVGCTTPRTEILVSLATDLAVPAELDQLRVRVTSESGQERFAKTYDALRAVLPLSLGLLPGGDKAVAFRVVADGISAGEVVVTRSALTSFVPGQSLMLNLDLLRVCRRVTCSAGQTCGGGGACGPDKVDPKTLPKLGATRDAGGGDTVADGAPDQAGVEKGAEPPPSEVGGETAPTDKPAEPMPDPALRASYRFDEGSGGAVKDDSMYANHGTTSATWVPGVAGSALRFEVVSKQVSVPDSAPLNVAGTELTLEAWVKRTLSSGSSGPQYQQIIQKIDSTAKTGYALEFRAIGSTFAMPRLCAFIGSGVVVCVAEEFPVGVWRHVAVTLGAATLRLYVNGGEVAAEGGHTESPSTNTASLLIGNQPGGSPNRVFHGDIDSVGVWARARTAAEICGDAGRTWSGSACV